MHIYLTFYNQDTIPCTLCPTLSPPLETLTSSGTALGPGIVNPQYTDINSSPTKKVRKRLNPPLISTQAMSALAIPSFNLLWMKSCSTCRIIQAVQPPGHQAPHNTLLNAYALQFLRPDNLFSKTQQTLECFLAAW